MVSDRGAAWQRPFAGVLAVLFLCGAVWATSIFVGWCAIDDSLYFPAVETGKQAAFPPGHFEFGWVAGVASATFAALTVAAVWWVIVGARRPIGSFGQASAATVGVGMLGAAIPCLVRYTVLGMAPLAIGGGLLLLASLWPWKSPPS